MKNIFLFLVLLWLFMPNPVVAQEKGGISSQKRQVNQEEQVYFNTNSKKYHKFDCRSAKQCTVNCVTKNLSEAIQLGGVPCKNCH